MAGFVSHHEREAEYAQAQQAAARRQRIGRQVALLESVAIEGLAVQPEVIDDLLLRHKLGGLAVPLEGDRVEAQEVTAALAQAA